MASLNQKISSIGVRAQSGLDWLTQGMALYVLPAALLLISLAALILWDNAYTSRSEQTLALQVLVQDEREPTLPMVRDELTGLPQSLSFNTRLTERPVWFRFQVDPGLAATGYQVAFPSRHATGMSCWNGETLASIGDSADTRVERRLTAVKAGYALKLTGADTSVICRAGFVGPARLSAALWKPDQLSIAINSFHRASGLIEGGLVVLALFVLISAAFNRQRIYVIFAAWLLVTMRLSATSGGWDDQWLNHVVPLDWLSPGRSFTRAAWALLTVTLFKQLFHEDLQRLRYAFAITVMQWFCMLLFLGAAVLPRSIFVPAMWALGLVWVPFFIFCLARIVMSTRSTASFLYSGSLAVTLLSTLLDIYAASYGIKGIDNSINSIIASLASGLLISLAIAEHMRQEHRERVLVQNQLQHAYDAIPIGMFTLDLQGRFTNINPALRKILGPRAFKTTHNTWQQYFGADIWQALLDLVQSRQDGDIEIRSQMDVTGFEGPRRYRVKAALSGDKIEGSLQDVTDKSVADDELNFLADNDALTKVLNRRGVEKAFNEAVAAIDDAHPLALAYLDLDRFKLINDLYGHNAGDEVLRQVCQRINSLLASHMRLGRVGGDEFVILLTDTRMPLATVISRGVIESIDEKPFRVGEKAFYVRGSIGLIEVSPGTQFKDVLSTSDRACREAKAGQHRGLVVYEHGSSAFKEHQAELRLIGELAASDTIAGLFLEMQPIMSLTRPNDGLNFEVLLRMRDSAGELVPVSRVIAAAEDSGRMSKIDHWVLSTTLAWLDQHQELLLRTQFVCINLSGASLNDEEFMQEVFDILRRNSHVSNFLCIEITESIALHDLKNTRRFIDKVRSYGARVALDDFGAGYTSFSYLKELPADLLKIDGSFIVNMNQHPANVSIVEAIVNLARNLGMKTIAEWAEDPATVQALAEIGVDYVQGYAVARPMAPEKLLEVKSAAGFIKNAELLRFVEALDRQNNPLAQLDLLIEHEKLSPPKIH